MLVINTQGIVLRTVKFNENDLIVSVFTRNIGKVSLLAKGAQKQKSRFLPCTQLFSYNNYVLKKSKDMYNLSQGDSIKSFYNLSSDIESFSYSSFLIKFVDTNLVDGQPNHRLFELVTKTLFLFSENVDNKKFILTSFILKCVDFLGYRPEVFKCTSCGNTEQIIGFSLEDGGLVCNKCKNDEKFYVNLDKTTISLMQYVLNNDIIICSKAKVSTKLVNEFFYLMKRYLINHFENINFKPLDLLEDLR